MRFVIVGAGAIGGVVGARLHDSGHDVMLIARGRHFEAIRSDGLVLETPDGTTRHEVDVVDDPGTASIGDRTVVLLCVKSQDTSAALEALATGGTSKTPVVCMQNGVANERSALRWFSNVYGVAVMCPALFLEPGVVSAYSTPTTGILDIGRYPSGADDRCAEVSTALAESTFLSKPCPDIMRWKYRKLLTNLGNAVEALCGAGARRGRLVAIARQEGERVLDAAGIEAVSTEDDLARRADHIRPGTIRGRTREGGSTWQSLRRGVRSTEVDYLNGEVVLLGRLHGVPTPVNGALQRLVRECAVRSTPPGTMSEDDILGDLARVSDSD